MAEINKLYEATPEGTIRVIKIFGEVKQGYISDIIDDKAARIITKKEIGVYYFEDAEAARKDIIRKINTVIKHYQKKLEKYQA